MFRNGLIRFLLSPLGLLYGIGVSIRNLLFDRGLLKSSRFSIPVISIGNLTVGGSGKTPHVEYLIRLLQPFIQVAILSRGYKREKPGFAMVEVSTPTKDVGDEPSLYKRKYQEVIVSVGEDRALGIPAMLSKAPHGEVVILDDAFQHRGVVSSKSILLTEFDNLYPDDYILPIGRLREWRSGAERADIIIVTKCPDNFKELKGNHNISKAEEIKNKLKLLPHQKLFFSGIKYGNLYSISNPNFIIPVSEIKEAVVFSGLAKPGYLKKYLSDSLEKIEWITFPDHHFYEPQDLGQIKTAANNLNSNSKYVITTEKDAVKMDAHIPYLIQNNLNIFILPMEVYFFEQENNFDSEIMNWLLNYKV
jgi:tetraacyldisaccharide 4'-kinase